MVRFVLYAATVIGSSTAQAVVRPSLKKEVAGSRPSEIRVQFKLLRNRLSVGAPGEGVGYEEGSV